MPAAIAVKLLLDAIVAVGYMSKPPMALMFWGFAIADAGALWISLRS